MNDQQNYTIYHIKYQHSTHILIKRDITHSALNKHLKNIIGFRIISFLIT